MLSWSSSDPCDAGSRVDVNALTAGGAHVDEAARAALADATHAVFWAIVVFHFLINGGGRWSLDRLIDREI